MATGTLQLHRQALDRRDVGPWNIKDYLFPVLVERGRTFLGLGVQGDGPVQVDVRGEGREKGVISEENQELKWLGDTAWDKGADR